MAPDGPPPAPSTAFLEPGGPAHVVVVGGGLAGLVTARALATAGVDVTVCEAGSVLGGKLRLAEVAGHRVDVGAEAMLAVRPEGVDLLRDLGAADELVSPTTTSASIWSRGALHPLPRATLMGVPTAQDGLSGLLTADELERWRAERPWPGGSVTADLAVGSYVRTRWGDAVADRLVEPLLGGVYAGRADELSLEATMPALWAAAVADGPLPQPAPVTDQAARPAFAGIIEGMGRLPGLLADDLTRRGVRVRTSTTVRAVSTGKERRFSVTVGPTMAEERILADAVVLATPPTAASRLLAQLIPEAATALGEVESSSSAVVTLALPRAGLPGLPGSGFLVPAVDGHVIKGATFSANKWAWTDALDPEVTFVRASLGRAGDVRDLQRDDRDLVTIAHQEIGEAIGAPLPDLVDAHVQRWGGGLPQYTVGHATRMATVREAVARRPGLEVSGAAYQGVGIPAVIASATGAAQRVLTHLRTLHPRL